MRGKIVTVWFVQWESASFGVLCKYLPSEEQARVLAEGKTLFDGPAVVRPERVERAWGRELTRCRNRELRSK